MNNGSAVQIVTFQFHLVNRISYIEISIIKSSYIIIIIIIIAKVKLIIIIIIIIIIIKRKKTKFYQ